MKLIITGSRTITDYEAVRSAVADTGLGKKYGRSIEVVCGMARGADMLGYEFARRNGLVCYEFPANWNKHGKRAGILRNIEMGEFSDALLALWDGESKGTEQMIEWAKANGLECYVVHVK